MYLLNHECAHRKFFRAYYLHSTMYLLNRKQNPPWADTKYKFTFHYVSIKSSRCIFQFVFVPSFTFHYVSIKSLFMTLICAIYLDLHSTMYLLNRLTSFQSHSQHLNLHSTMYLLNRRTGCHCNN